MKQGNGTDQDFLVTGGDQEFYISYKNADGSENSSPDDMNSMLSTRSTEENVDWESAIDACNGEQGKWERAPDTCREFADWLDSVDWDSLPHIEEDD
jgi:hypothetical protein